MVLWECEFVGVCCVVVNVFLCGYIGGVFGVVGYEYVVRVLVVCEEKIYEGMVVVGIGIGW